ncbi:MAG TPA: nitroreductase family protein [Bacillota bacterium]|nr:nitroreductase family protein [Bacillota bacterium]
MAKNFYTAVAERRSIYGISKDSVVSEEKIREIIEHALTYTPSAFNSQSARIVLLLEAAHDRLWDITKEALRKIVPPDEFDVTAAKIDAFQNGYGTVLFFEDQKVVESLQSQFPAYKNNFPVWSQQSNGMHQYVVWTALELEGLGATLQHYGELIEIQVKQEWNLPDHWKLIAQMPFGKPTAQPDPKEMQPLADRMRVFK